MALTELLIKNAKALFNPLTGQPTTGDYKLTDGGGMYLLVQANGAKYWRLNYRFAGKRKTLALGVYPDVSLSDARERRDDARKLLSKDIDPSAAKQEKKAAVKALTENSFEAVAGKWYTNKTKVWKESQCRVIKARLEKDIYPWLGSKPIGDITAPELLTVLRRIESRGAIESARRACAMCGEIFIYAIAEGSAQVDPSAGLKKALTPHKVTSLATITDPVKIGELLRDIDAYMGSFVVRCAFKIAPMVFLRPGELSSARWEEFDLDNAEWRIPDKKMKKERLHIIPLPTQAMEILRELQPLTGRGEFVFPSLRDGSKSMGKNTIVRAIRNLGYTPEEMTAHGFRHMASTLLNEQGFNSDAIEMQLSHKPQGVRGIYNAAKYLPERQRMMQSWADYLDGLKKGADVINLHQNRA